MFFPAGDNDTVVYLEEVPLQAFPMFKGIVLLSTSTQNLLARVLTVALLASAHNCVTNSTAAFSIRGPHQPLNWK